MTAVLYVNPASKKTMAAKKKTAKRKKPRTAAQKRATAKMIAANRKARGGSKPKRKKRKNPAAAAKANPAPKRKSTSKRKKPRTAAQKAATAKMLAANRRGGSKPKRKKRRNLGTAKANPAPRRRARRKSNPGVGYYVVQGLLTIAGGGVGILANRLANEHVLTSQSPMARGLIKVGTGIVVGGGASLLAPAFGAGLGLGLGLPGAVEITDELVPPSNVPALPPPATANGEFPPRGTGAIVGHNMGAIVDRPMGMVVEPNQARHLQSIRMGAVGVRS